MSDVVKFLLARLDEDEAGATAATPGPWRYDPTKCWIPPAPFRRPAWAPDGEETVSAGPSGSDATTVCTTGPADDLQSMRDARHIARHDPARVLAEVAAKRAIVAHLDRLLEGPEDGDERSATVMLYGAAAILCTIRHLAATYADHPGYLREWAP